MKILANDGLHPSGIKQLEEAGHQVDTTTVSASQLINYINEHQIKVVLVRSATQITKTLIDQCPSIKMIGRGGVGMDNIAVAYAESKGIKVVNTPDASARAVAELSFAHILSGARYLYDANRNMPLEGDTNFKDLKKSYSTGTELKGKTLGVFGFGNIGKETAKIGLSMGMNVMFYDPEIQKATLELSFYNNQKISFELEVSTKEEVLKKADFISLHIPAQDSYCLDKEAFKLMKKGVGIVNTARGSAMDEVALIAHLDNGTVGFAGLDVFESEPKPEIQILMHPNISLSPHIGAATLEAQEKIGISLANQILNFVHD